MEDTTMISEEEIKLRLFECIANNYGKHYMSPKSIVCDVNSVYRELYLTNIYNART